MAAETSDPPVVAVVVTCDPGPWLEEALASLAAQDHRNLSVLVIDAGSVASPAGRIAAAAPDAVVHRLQERVTRGRATNEVLGVVEGASHFLLCHDDVALAPDAVRLLVGEALRANAGLASPKLVDWDHPDRLLAVGLGADKVGVVHGLVERGELDQQQHDAVRDIFVAPGAATLVRADLFETLGGLDAGMGGRGGDLDLCWRAHLAGARIVAVPAARVRHLEACAAPLSRGDPAPPGGARPAETLCEQHRIRTLLCCYSWRSLVWVVPLVMADTFGSALVALVAGHPGRAASRVATLIRALRSPGELRRVRRRVQHQRRLSDRALRRRQTRGHARLRAWARTRLGVPGAAAPVAARVGGRPALLVGAALVVLLAAGSRHLIGHELPAIGQIPDTSRGLGAWWRAWWSTRQPSGLGRTGPSPPALALLVVAGGLCFGAVGTLQHILVLGPLLVGPIGAYRAGRGWGSAWARLAALVAYAVVPLPYDALAGGHWAGLLAYAAAPWTLALLGRAADLPPAAGLRSLWSTVAPLGLLTALAGAFVPSFVVVVPVVGGALALGSLLVARYRAAVRLVLVAAAAGGLGFVLLLPWSLPLVAAPASVFGPSAGATARLSFASLLRMDTGPLGHGPLGWGLLAAAALPLLTGRSWRLAWAARLWTVVVVCVAWAWLGLEGRVPLPAPEVVLAPAAAALAASVGLGVVAFEVDLPGYRFGWRQVASALGAVGVALSVLPFLGGLDGGRWGLPSAGSSQVLAGEETSSPDPSTVSRLLWIGAPDAIPLASWPLLGGQAWATSAGGPPDVVDEWADGVPRGAALIARDIGLARAGLTTDLGSLLAPLGVRYVVVPNHDAPSGTGAAVTPTSEAVASGLALQTDLDQLAVDANYTVYENAVWAPDVRAPHGSSRLYRSLQLLVMGAWAELLVGGRRLRVSPSGAPAPTRTSGVAGAAPSRWRRRRPRPVPAWPGESDDGWGAHPPGAAG